MGRNGGESVCFDAVMQDMLHVRMTEAQATFSSAAGLVKTVRGKSAAQGRHSLLKHRIVPMSNRKLTVRQRRMKSLPVDERHCAIVATIEQRVEIHSEQALLGRAYRSWRWCDPCSRPRRPGGRPARGRAAVAGALGVVARVLPVCATTGSLRQALAQPIDRGGKRQRRR